MAGPVRCVPQSAARYRCVLSRDLKLSLLAGALAGFVGAAGFIVVHAVVIVPIWGQAITRAAVVALVVGSSVG